MDPEQIGGAIANLVVTIKEQVRVVKANKEQCEALCHRIEIVEAALDAIKQLTTPSQNYLLGLMRLMKCLENCNKFISVFTDTRRIKQFLMARRNQRKFDELTSELQGISGLLNLGLSTQQLVNREQDLKNQAQDNKQLQALLKDEKFQMNDVFVAMQLQQSQMKELLQHYNKSLQHTSKTDEVMPQSSLIDKHMIIPFCELDIEGVIAEGGLGVVYKGKWNDETVAIKIVQSMDKEARNEFEREVQIMSRLRSPSITRFYGACFEEGNECLVMEYLSQGSLTDYLQQAGRTLNIFARTTLVIEIARGVKYLHQQNILHRDLKSGNVLIDKDGHPRVSDFGLAKIQSVSVRTIERRSQALAWMSPEVLHRGNEYTDKADIYSLGVVCWEVLTGKVPPNQSATEIKTARAILQVPTHLPELHRALIQQCWDPTPSSRPTIDDIIKQLEDFNHEDALIKARQLCQQGMDHESAGRYQEAARCYESSGDLGYARALGNLGMFALKGLGGRIEDKPAAAVLFEKAALQEHGRSQLNLGLMLANGDGVPRDIEKALYWLLKAEKNGRKEASGLITKLNEESTTEPRLS